MMIAPDHEPAIEDGPSHRPPGSTGPAPTMRSRSSTPTGQPVERFTVTHTASGLRQLVRSAAPRRCRRGGDRTPRRPGGRRAARGRADGVRDRPEPGQEPAQPLRLGRQQGRRVRRLRPGRRAAHRPSPAAPADPRQRRHHHAADDRAGPPGPRPRPGRDGQPAPRAPADHAARRDRPVPRHRLRDHACGS